MIWPIVRLPPEVTDTSFVFEAERRIKLDSLTFAVAVLTVMFPFRTDAVRSSVLVVFC